MGEGDEDHVLRNMVPLCQLARFQPGVHVPAKPGWRNQQHPTEVIRFVLQLLVWIACVQIALWVLLTREDETIWVEEVVPNLMSHREPLPSDRFIGTHPYLATVEESATTVFASTRSDYLQEQRFGNRFYVYRGFQSAALIKKSPGRLFAVFLSDGHQ